MGLFQRIIGMLVDTRIEEMRAILRSLPVGTRWAAIAETRYFDEDGKLVEQSGVVHSDGRRLGLLTWKGVVMLTASLKTLEVDIQGLNMMFTHEGIDYRVTDIRSIRELILDAPRFAVEIDKVDPFGPLQTIIVEANMLGAQAWSEYD